MLPIPSSSSPCRVLGSAVFLSFLLAFVPSTVVRAQGVVSRNTTGGINDTQIAGSGGVNPPPAAAAGTGGTTNVDNSLGGFGTNQRSDVTPRPLPPRSHVRY